MRLIGIPGLQVMNQFQVLMGMGDRWSSRVGKGFFPKGEGAPGVGRLDSGQYKVFSSNTVPVSLIPRARRVKNNLTHGALSSCNKFFTLLATSVCCTHSLILFFRLLTWKDTSAQALINGVRFCDAPRVICRHCPSTKGVGAFDELTQHQRLLFRPGARRLGPQLGDQPPL